MAQSWSASAVMSGNFGIGAHPFSSDRMFELAESFQGHFRLASLGLCSPPALRRRTDFSRAEYTRPAHGVKGSSQVMPGCGAARESLSSLTACNLPLTFQFDELAVGMVGREGLFGSRCGTGQVRGPHESRIGQGVLHKSIRFVIWLRGVFQRQLANHIAPVLEDAPALIVPIRDDLRRGWGGDLLSGFGQCAECGSESGGVFVVMSGDIRGSLLVETVPEPRIFDQAREHRQDDAVAAMNELWRLGALAGNLGLTFESAGDGRREFPGAPLGDGAEGPGVGPEFLVQSGDVIRAEFGGDGLVLGGGVGERHRGPLDIGADGGFETVLNRSVLQGGTAGGGGERKGQQQRPAQETR
jgi:hypothetical protein